MSEVNKGYLSYYKFLCASSKRKFRMGIRDGDMRFEVVLIQKLYS